MNAEFNFFEVLKSFVLYISPVVIIMGFLLILYGNYRRIEETLARELGGIRKKTIPKFETNIYTFHEWLLEKRILTGIFFIICGVFFYFFGKSTL